MITEKSTLAEILKYSAAKNVLIKYQVPCLACPMAQFEMGQLALGQICKVYGINIAPLIEELNAALSKTDNNSDI